MGRTYNPSSYVSKQHPQERAYNQSVFKTLNGDVDLGTPTGTHPQDGGVNSGVYNQFQKGNGSGILIRIDGSGSSGTGAAYSWAGTGVGVALDHGLGRQPIGYHVVDSDKDVRVFRTVAPDASQITLAPTDNTASVTVYVF